MSDLIQRIVNLIHQHVNPFSPANSTLYHTYKEDPKKYEEMMIEQKNRYLAKDPKYFLEPSIHINILSNDWIHILCLPFLINLWESIEEWRSCMSNMNIKGEEYENS